MMLGTAFPGDLLLLGADPDLLSKARGVNGREETV